MRGFLVFCFFYFDINLINLMTVFARIYVYMCRGNDDFISWISSKIYLSRFESIEIGLSRDSRFLHESEISESIATRLCSRIEIYSRYVCRAWMVEHISKDRERCDALNFICATSDLNRIRPTKFPIQLFPRVRFPRCRLPRNGIIKAIASSLAKNPNCIVRSSMVA